MAGGWPGGDEEMVIAVVVVCYCHRSRPQSVRGTGWKVDGGGSRDLTLRRDEDGEIHTSPDAASYWLLAVAHY